MVQFSGGSVTFCGGLLFFSRARAREGFGDISGILAFSAEGGLRPTILRFSKNVYFLRESVAGCFLRPFTDGV